MKTPKKLAMEIAEELVVLKKPGSKARYVEILGYGIAIQKTLASKLAQQFETVKTVDRVRRKFAQHIEEAILLAMSECPVPGSPMSEEEHEKIAELIRDWWERNDKASALIEALYKFQDHLDYLHRVMQTPESQEFATGYDVGYKQGYAKAEEELNKKPVGEIHILWNQDMGENG